jgi:biopolymer transport protein ExbD
MLMVDRRHATAKVKCPNCGRVATVPEAARRQAAALEIGPAALASVGRADARPQGQARPEVPEEVLPVRFVGRRQSDEEMDMTPMVDVTFLLLIFFMVTAAYHLQRSIEIPPPDQRESAAQARTLEELEQDDDYVIVEIHGDNTVFVDDNPAPSKQELLVRLREAREGVPGSGSKGPSSLLVLASGECRHEMVVMALDAGNAVGMEHIRLATEDEKGF